MLEESILDEASPKPRRGSYILIVIIFISYGFKKPITALSCGKSSPAQFKSIECMPREQNNEQPCFIRVECT